MLKLFKMHKNISFYRHYEKFPKNYLVAQLTTDINEENFCSYIIDKKLRKSLSLALYGIGWSS